MVSARLAFNAIRYFIRSLFWTSSNFCVDGDAWDDGLRIYNELNGGRLYNKIKMVKLPKDKDVCDLRGDIEEYYYEIK